MHEYVKYDINLYGHVNAQSKIKTENIKKAKCMNMWNMMHENVLYSPKKTLAMFFRSTK